MEKSSNGFVRADQIDLKSLDEQLERHLNRAWTMEKNKKKNQEEYYSSSTTSTAAVAAVPAPLPAAITPRRQRQEWEIDPSKLIIKGVLARGTFGTVHGAFTTARTSPVSHRLVSLPPFSFLIQ
ncbi:UNVERIFIED_CONTAM: hypothetical protein Sradi_4050200 [Sesamum radiatum]|uniref:Uncharacterized protein n=1 Tax=Sesamum radiatum TaxID=300843 RepID=A0AAW2PLU4_SESRA